MSKREKFPNFKKRNGLLIAIIQNFSTKRVLMHGFMNPEALRLCRKTGEVWLWSTSEKKLWHKGVTSNSVMKIKKVRADCDGDAILLLVKVTGTGYACHLKRHSCFVPIGLDDIVF